MQKNINKAIIAHKEGRLIEAERLYLIVLKELPNHSEILNNLAIIQVHNSKFKDAVCHVWSAGVNPLPPYLSSP
mgnify:CR=1 FL=1